MWKFGLHVRRRGEQRQNGGEDRTVSGLPSATITLCKGIILVSLKLGHLLYLAQARFLNIATVWVVDNTKRPTLFTPSDLRFRGEGAVPPRRAHFAKCHWSLASVITTAGEVFVLVACACLLRRCDVTMCGVNPLEISAPRKLTSVIELSRPRLPRADLVWWGVCVKTECILCKMFYYK